MNTISNEKSMIEKNTVKIKCNPYTQKIEYYRWDLESEEWCALVSPESPFFKQEFTDVSLHHKAYEIIYHMNKIYNPGNVGLDVFFEGTKEDMEVLSEIIEQYFPSCNVHIILGDTYLLSASIVKEQVENIFSDMKKIFSEYPDNEVIESINKFNETVRPAIPICVMGLYSAGKSALINSLIGVELLPSASDPTTAKTYKISSGTKYEIKFTYTDKGKNPKNVILSFNNNMYQVNQSAELEIVAKLDAIKQYDTTEERMYYALSIINNYDMEHNRNIPDNKKIWRVSDLIEVTLPINTYVLPFDKFDFTIFDTPGSNSASNTDHTEVLRKSMEGQTNGLPIFVTTPDSMDGTDNNKLINTIEKLGGALDKSNLIIVVNQADLKDCETLENKKKNFNNLAVSNLNPAGTYFVSAIIGLGAKKMLSGNTKENKKGELIPNWIDKTYSKTFNSNLSYYDETNDDEEFVRLYSYNIIPQNQFDNYTSAGICEDNDNLVYCNSGLHAIESAIRDFALKYAIYNKCRNASGYLSNALGKLKDTLAILTQKQSVLSKQLNSNMTQQEQQVLNQLNEKCKSGKREYMDLFSSKLNEPIKNEVDYLDDKANDIIKNIWNKTKGKKGRKEILAKQLNDLINEKVKLVWKKSTILALDFWKAKQNEFKQELISIVVESPNLTKQQQDLLKDAIMQINCTPNYTFNVLIKGEVIVGEFLFIKILKAEEAKKQLMDCFDNGCISVNGALTQQSLQAFDQLTREVESQYQYLISEYNPKMLELRRQLKECNGKLDYMMKEYTQIQNCLLKINSLTAFRPIEK